MHKQTSKLYYKHPEVHLCRSTAHCKAIHPEVYTRDTVRSSQSIPQRVSIGLKDPYDPRGLLRSNNNNSSTMLIPPQPQHPAAPAPSYYFNRSSSNISFDSSDKKTDHPSQQQQQHHHHAVIDIRGSSANFPFFQHLLATESGTSKVGRSSKLD